MTTAETSAATVGRAAGISVFAQVLSKGLRFVLVNVLLASRLGPAEFGRFVLVFATMQVAQLLGMFGQSTVISRFVSLRLASGDYEGARGYLWTAFGVGLVGTLSTCGLALVCAEEIGRFFHDPDLVGALRAVLIGGLGAVTLTLVSVTFGVVVAPLRLVLVRDLLPALAMVGALLPVCWAGNGVVEAAYGCGLGYLLVGGAALYLQMRSLPASLRGRRRRPSIRGVLRFSLPNALVGAVVFLNVQADRAMLGRMASLREVGIYSVAAALAAQLYIIPVSLNTLFAPRAASLLSESISEAAELFNTVLRWGLATGLGGAASVVALSEPLLGLSGSEFVQGKIGLLVLAGGVGAFGSAGALAGSALQAGGRPGGTAIATVASLALNVGLNAWLIPELGMVGAAIGTAGGAAAYACIGTVLAVRWLNLSLAGRGLGRVAAGFVCVVGISVVGQYWLNAYAVLGLVAGSWLLVAVFALRPSEDPLARQLRSRVETILGRS